MKKFLTELKQRNVFRIAVLYGVSAWMILSVADILFGILDFPEGAMRVMFYALLLGFPVALVLSWLYELTPEGIKREFEIQPGDSVREQTVHRLNIMIFAGAVLVAIGMALQYFVFPNSDSRTTSEFPANSIAVLPFVDMSPEGDQEYFADGLSEELLNLLAKMPELHVAARTSSFAFKGKNEDVPSIAEQLRVAHVLEGSVRKAGNDVRITAQLIEAGQGYHLFSETYDRKLDDIFKVQDDISAAVVEQLKIALLDENRPKARNTDPEAFDLYLQGKAFWRLYTTEGFSQAIDMLNSALAIDPDYAPAWAELGLVYMAMDRIGHEDKNLQMGREALNRALSIDKQLPEAWAGLSDMAFNSWEFDEALEYQQAALDLPGDNALVLRRAGSLAGLMGESEKSIDYYNRSLKIDPMSFALRYNLGMAYFWSNKPRQALEYFDKAAVLNPVFSQLPFRRGMSMLASGDPAAALGVFEADPNPARRLQGMAMAYHDLGQEVESSAAANEMEETYLAAGWRSQLAKVRAYRGEKDRAFELLEMSYENRDPSLLSVAVDPHFDKLHVDQRWAVFINKIGVAGNPINE